MVSRISFDIHRRTTTRPADTLFEGAILKARLMFPNVSQTTT